MEHVDWFESRLLNSLKGLEEWIKKELNVFLFQGSCITFQSFDIILKVSIIRIGTDYVGLLSFFIKVKNFSESILRFVQSQQIWGYFTLFIDLDSYKTVLTANSKKG